jgi:hypothetical protein
MTHVSLDFPHHKERSDHCKRLIKATHGYEDPNSNVQPSLEVKKSDKK